jgi:tRNA pseudouridine13 synthase
VLPLLTADLPGVGGRLRAEPDDFQVEELPAYLPSGEGDHVYVFVEKVDLTTHEAVRRLAQALRVNPSECGTAGLKDRHARTRQWISLPRPATPEAALAAKVDGLTILQASRHRNKLKTGHLRGNRFRLVIRDVTAPADEAAARAAAILARLAAPPGMPNWYGEQRFGARGDNAARGRALVRGEPCQPPPRDGREQRLLLSAWQSELFNQYLKSRLDDGTFARVLDGDLMQVVASGGVFTSTEPDVDQARLERGEIVPTGPMFGGRMPTPPPGTAAAAREQSILAGEHPSPDMLTRHGLLSGTRRALAVRVGEPVAEIAGPAAIAITFALPAGCYATVVAGEVMHASEPANLPGISCS